MTLPLSPQADPLVLSPMVDVTDAAFRSLAREWGADVTCSEMAAAAGIVHGNDKSWSLVQPWPGEAPYGVQLMGGEPTEVAEAARLVVERIRPDFIDLNLGCPSPHILQSCAGGFLLKDPRHAGRVIRAVVEAVEEAGPVRRLVPGPDGPVTTETIVPKVSVKMRTGMDSGHLTFLDVGREAEAAGAAWCTLHGRTVAQGYSGSADWTAIRRLVDGLTIPVVGNGDLRTPDDVVRMRDETGCAGFFIARAAMHDPTVFRRMRQALGGGETEAAPELDARLQALSTYLDRASSIGITHVAGLRRQAGRFMAGAPGAKRLRVAMQACRSAEEVRSAVAEAMAAAVAPSGAR